LHINRVAFDCSLMSSGPGRDANISVLCEWKAATSMWMAGSSCVVYRSSNLHR